LVIAREEPEDEENRKVPARHEEDAAEMTAMKKIVAPEEDEFLWKWKVRCLRCFHAFENSTEFVL